MTPASRLIDGILSALLPAYRDNLTKARLPVQNETSSSAATTTTIPADIVGTWTGEVQTHGGNVSLRFEIKSDGSIAAALGKQPPVTLTNIRATAEPWPAE